MAFALIALIVLVLLMVQVAMVLVDQVAVTQAAREGARSMAVGGDAEDASSAAKRSARLDDDRVRVTSESLPGPPAMVRVEVTYEETIVFPLTDRILVRPRVAAFAVMRDERLR